MIGVSLRVILTLAATTGAGAQEQSSTIDDAGTLRLPNGETVPYSNLASPEARSNFIDLTQGYERILAPRPTNWTRKPGETAAEEMRRWYDDAAYIPWLARLRRHFSVSITPKIIAGVQTDVIDPAQGIAERNLNRILINLHGGGMVVGARYGGQLESVPIASVGRIRVITVDYRMAPENRYPAAETDVIAVYRELLKTYPAQNIGIYGCSSGSALTATTTARLVADGQPKPGAIGMFGDGPVPSHKLGDSNYIFSGGKPTWPEGDDEYLRGVNLRDPVNYPAGAEVNLRRFPPSLMISGTRDAALSRTLVAHASLVNLGVDAELHVWEGAPHCSFAQPFVDPNVPESQQAWQVITKFFDRHLGRSAH